MTALEALAATVNRPLLARPVGMTQGGYYVDAGAVWDYHPLRLGSDLEAPYPVRALFPSWGMLTGEWEVIERDA